MILASQSRARQMLLANDGLAFEAVPADIDERAIQQGLFRYAACMDMRDWAGLDSVLAADATADFGIGPIAGRDEIVRFTRSFLDDCGPTQHLLGNIFIEVDGDRATSRAYVADLHLGTGTQSQTSYRTLGLYMDRWACTPDGWRITERIKDNRGHLGDMSVLGRTV